MSAGILGWSDSLLSFTRFYQSLNPPTISQNFPNPKVSDRLQFDIVNCGRLHYLDTLRFNIRMCPGPDVLDKIEAFKMSRPICDVVFQRWDQHHNRLNDNHPSYACY